MSTRRRGRCAVRRYLLPLAADVCVCSGNNAANLDEEVDLPTGVSC